MPASPKTDNALHLLTVVGERGLTWQELAAATGSHHGSASSMLSTLHKRGAIVRLAERRSGSSVYVGLDHIAGRDVIGSRERKAIATAAVDVEALMAALEAVAELQRVADTALLEAQHAAAMHDFEADLLAKDEANRKKYSARMKAADSQRELDQIKAVAAARDKGREEGEANGWQDGYDEGVKRGQESATGDDSFIRGRELGRSEGEDLIRRRVHAVSAEMHKVILENTPLRSHFKGCYVIHPECTIKALSRSAGITAARPLPLSQVG